MKWCSWPHTRQEKEIASNQVLPLIMFFALKGHRSFNMTRHARGKMTAPARLVTLFWWMIGKHRLPCIHSVLATHATFMKRHMSQWPIWTFQFFWVARPLKVSSQDLLSAPSMYDPFIWVCSHSLPVLKVLESKAQRLSHLSALCKVY